jgi:hypothetical protein
MEVKECDLILHFVFTPDNVSANLYAKIVHTPTGDHVEHTWLAVDVLTGTALAKAWLLATLARINGIRPLPEETEQDFRTRQLRLF